MASRAYGSPNGSNFQRGKKKCTRIQIGITRTKCSLIGQGVHISERNRLPVLSNYATNIFLPGSDHDNKAR